MTTPYEPLFKMQMALWEGWVHAATDSVVAYQRLWEQQRKILDRHGYFRCRNIVPQGADWFDHYGKRHDDVDVEKV